MSLVFRRHLPTSALHGTYDVFFTFTSFNVQRSLSTTHRHSHQSILTQIHPQHFYQIINNVDEYRHFLPYCHESKILQVSSCGTMMDAVLRVGLPIGSSGSGSLLEERYVSRVRMIAPNREDEQVWIVEAKSIQSKLFDSLKSRWKLSIAEAERPDGHVVNGESRQTSNLSCRVNFDVEIEVSNPLISFTLDKVLKDVARKQVDAFEKRCRDIPFGESC